MAKTFRMDMRNAAEDVPRLILGSGRACGGTFYLRLRLDTNHVVLAHQVGKVMRVYESARSDVPRMPIEVASVDDATTRLSALDARLPGRVSPGRRGQWSATLVCEDKPILMLERRIAAYGTVLVVSDPDAGKWNWKVEREERWFSVRSDLTGSATSLSKAILAAYTAVDGLIGDACTVRDTRRRAGLDAAYAEVHPNRPARERAEPKAPNAKARKRPAPPAAPAPPAPPPPPPPSPPPAARPPRRARGDGSSSRGARPRGPRIPSFEDVLDYDGGADVGPAAPVKRPGRVLGFGRTDAEKDKALIGLFAKSLDEAMAAE